MVKARWLPQSRQKYRVASGVDFSFRRRALRPGPCRGREGDPRHRRRGLHPAADRAVAVEDAQRLAVRLVAQGAAEAPAFMGHDLSSPDRYRVHHRPAGRRSNPPGYSSPAIVSRALFAVSTMRSISASVTISGGAKTMMSRTARTMTPRSMQWSRHLTPTFKSGSKRVREALSAASSIAPIIPMPRTSPTSGWSASSRNRACR